ncbi:MAG: hypothetical protein ACYTBJ_18700 [Planctomycetota bacterium]
MSIPLWRKVHEQLELDLKRARAEQSVFDYEELIEDARAADLEDRMVDPVTDEHETRWALDLHALANGPMLPVLVLVWWMSLMVVGAAVAAL